MQLRRPASDIQGWNLGARKKTQYCLDVLSAHHLLARRPRLNVAVNAGEIAVAAHVDLKNIHRATVQGSAGEMKLFDKGPHRFANRFRFAILYPRSSIVDSFLTDNNSNPAHRCCRK